LHRIGREREHRLDGAKRHLDAGNPPLHYRNVAIQIQDHP